MRRILFNIIIPASILILWMLVWYYTCNKADGFDWFMFWIGVGCPYGIRKMCLFLVPQNFGISGGFAVLAMNFLIGGLIGGFVVIVRIIQMIMEIVDIISNHFWT